LLAATCGRNADIGVGFQLIATTRRNEQTGFYSSIVLVQQDKNGVLISSYSQKKDRPLLP